MDRSSVSIIGFLLITIGLSLSSGCSSCRDSRDGAPTPSPTIPSPTIPSPTPTDQAVPILAPGEGVTGSWEIVADGRWIDRIDMTQVGQVVEGKISDGRVLAATVEGDKLAGTLGGPDGVSFSATIAGEELNGTSVFGEKRMTFTAKRLRSSPREVPPEAHAAEHLRQEGILGPKMGQTAATPESRK